MNNWFRIFQRQPTFSSLGNIPIVISVTFHYGVIFGNLVRTLYIINARYTGELRSNCGLDTRNFDSLAENR